MSPKYSHFCFPAISLKSWESAIDAQFIVGVAVIVQISSFIQLHIGKLTKPTAATVKMINPTNNPSLDRDLVTLLQSRNKSSFGLGQVAARQLQLNNMQRGASDRISLELD